MSRSASRRWFGRCCCSAVFAVFPGCNALSDSDDETSGTVRTNVMDKIHGTPSKPQHDKIPNYAVNHSDEKRTLSITIAGGEEVVSKSFTIEAGERKGISAVSGSDQPISVETQSGLKNSKPAKPGALSMTIDNRADSMAIRSKTFSGGN